MNLSELLISAGMILFALILLIPAKGFGTLIDMLEILLGGIFTITTNILRVILVLIVSIFGVFIFISCRIFPDLKKLRMNQSGLYYPV
jgi:hypothetical protein